MKKFYPVVHCEDNEQIQKNVEIAKNNNVDGVFLINHSQMIQYNFEAVVARYTQYHSSENFKIGANFLNLSNIEALEKAVNFGLDMLWMDNGGFDHLNKFQDEFYEAACEFDESNKIEIFAGVHFKYQAKPTRSIRDSVTNCLLDTFIPTLSGSATGTPASVDFIRDAFSACQDLNDSMVMSDRYKLAIASGISIENVEVYLPYIDHFLVASSILDKNDDRLFDEEKLKMLCERIHLYETK